MADTITGFRPQSGLIERWLAWRGEPFQWGVPPDDMSNFLRGHGFQLLEMATTQQMSPRAAASALDGENRVVRELLEFEHSGLQPLACGHSSTQNSSD